MPQSVEQLDTTVVWRHSYVNDDVTSWVQRLLPFTLPSSEHGCTCCIHTHFVSVRYGESMSVSLLFKVIGVRRTQQP